jgi:hypothetical protein|tara:strand:- start:831 stop:1229 length:399 start_codon:yes stop_codon:yes gene_type:complete
MLSGPAAASDAGQFTFLGHQQCAPFEGVLFDVPALSEILARNSTANLACQARIEYELSVEAASYELELRNWEIQYNALHEETSLLIFQKDEEIDHLQRALLKQSPRNNWVWVAGGVAVGMVATYGAYKVFNE